MTKQVNQLTNEDESADEDVRQRVRYEVNQLMYGDESADEERLWTFGSAYAR